MMPERRSAYYIPSPDMAFYLPRAVGRPSLLNPAGKTKLDFSRAEIVMEKIAHCAVTLFFVFSAGERLPPQCRQRGVHQDVSDAQWQRSGDRRHPRRTPRPAGPPEIWIFPLKGGWQSISRG